MITLALIEGLVEKKQYNQARSCLDAIKNQLTKKQYDIIAEGLFQKQMVDSYNKIAERDRQVNNKFAEALRSAVKELKEVL